MSQSLRIAFVLNPFTLKRKGGEHAPSLAAELLGRGHELRVYGDVSGGVPQSAAGPELEGGVAPLEGVGLHGFSPEVIVAYDALSPAAWRGARGARKLRVPLVLVEEGFPETGRPVERVLRWFGERFWGPYVRRTGRRVIALDPVAEEQTRADGFSREQVVVMPAGVDLTLFRPGLTSELPARHGVRGRFLLHIGRLEDARGIQTLVHAFADTVGRREDWSLVFAGAGAAQPRLRALVDQLGISARVHWLGVPRTEVLPGLLGAATALVVPTLDDDVASLKIRRAMACGLPILASDVSRLNSLVEHEKSGLLVPAGDRAAWTDALRRLTSDPARRRRWGARGRELAEERFAWPRIADAFEELLQEVVAANAALLSSRRAAVGDA